MKNFVFISPNFPMTYWKFCAELKKNGMRVLGISCITNMAAGVLDQPINHEEVMATGKRVRNDFANLLKEIVAGL